jgi:hypothetical protein
MRANRGELTEYDLLVNSVAELGLACMLGQELVVSLVSWTPYRSPARADWRLAPTFLSLRKRENVLLISRAVETVPWAGGTCSY